MAGKQEKVIIVAETLAQMATAAGAATATATGIAVLPVGLATIAINGIFNILIRSATERPDIGKLVDKIRDDGTARTVETIRQAVIVAAGLKPEYRTAIEELAEAVSDPKGQLDEARFRAAIDKLLRVLGENARFIPEIRDGITAVGQSQDQLLQGQAEIKAAIAKLSQRDLGFQSGEERQGSGAVVSGPSSLSQPHQSYLVSQIDTLSSELRALLNEKGQQKWDAINQALRDHTWPEVFALTANLEKWLDDQGNRLSPAIKGRALLTLSDVVIIRDSGGPYSTRCGDTINAWRYLRQAETVFGTAPSEENLARLVRVRTKLEFIDGKHEESLLRLEGLDEPGAISLRIAMLGELDRWTDASDLILLQSQPHVKWCDDAIVAHVRAKRDSAADDLLAWSKAQEDQPAKHRCVLAYCREHYNRVSRQGSSGVIATLGEPDREELRRLQEELQDVLRTITILEGPKSGLQAEALELAILLGHGLNDHDACEAAAELLGKWKPVSLELARAVLRRDIGSLADLPDRLLQEHGDLFQAKLLACVLYTDSLGQPEKALDLLLAISVDSLDADERQEVATSLLVAAQYCREERLCSVSTAVTSMVGADHRISGMLRAIVCSRKGEFARAAEELTKTEDRDDYLWVELTGGLAVAQEQWQLAAERFHRAAELTGNAEVFRAEAMAWHKTGDINKTMSALEAANRLDPGRESTLHNLAAAYQHLGRYQDAVRVYAELRTKCPSNEATALNYASCLALSGEAEDALTVLNDECGQEGVSARPVLMRAHLLFALGRPKPALDSLKPFREQFWGDYRFLLAVLQLGYAAEEEDVAHAAFKRLIELQRSGDLPEGVFDRHTVEELPSMMEAWRGQQERINQEYLRGRLPWIAASRWVQPSGFAYRDWLIRTQDMVVADHPDALAEYSIYATNGFTVGEFQGHRWLVRLRSASKNAAVVVDMSSLIALHRLGLINKLPRCYAQVVLPSSYRAHWLEEQAHIPHHQPEQVHARQAIVDAVKNGRLDVQHPSESGLQFVLDEYERTPNSDTRVVRILQVAQWLQSQGNLSESDYQRVRRADNQASLIAEDEVDRALSGGRLWATAFTLQTIHHLGVLNAFLTAIRFDIPSDELREVERELSAMQVSDEAGSWHRELTALLREENGFDFRSVKTKDSTSEQHSAVHYAIDATLLAIQEDMPLVVDDRYCQQGRLAATPLQPDKAFSTDVLLEHMAEQGLIDSGQHADSWLQLMRWRYKFLLPPVSVLLTVANRFKKGVPGSELQEIAVYMHDCMRDLGLYGGRENTDPPMPMAAKLFNAWVDLVAHFCVELWWDDRFSEEQASRFTRWVVTNCLPSWPKNLGPATGRALAQLSTQALLGAAVQHCMARSDLRKANRVINRVRRSLGLSLDDLANEFKTLSAHLIDGIGKFEEAVVRGIYVRLLELFFGRRTRIIWKLLQEAECLGIVSSDSNREEIDEALLAAVMNRDDTNRLSPKVGPFAFIGISDKATTIFLPDMLAARSANLRRAALDDLKPQANCPKTPSTAAVLQEKKELLGREAAREWVPAAVALDEALEEDFLLNIAGFEQSQGRGYEDGCGRCWKKIIQPSAETLLWISDDGWTILTDSARAVEVFTVARQASACLSDFLHEYEHLAGHLALANPLDLGTQLNLYAPGKDLSAADWDVLNVWLKDMAKPWRRYHACQALLVNPRLVPTDKLGEFWQIVADIASLVTPDRLESDEAQVWRLHAELAAHYLRILELSGVPVHAARLLTVAWWAAARVTDMLLCHISTDSIPSQIREWRKQPFLHGTALAHNSWAWLSPQSISPARFVTMHSSSPLSISLLIELGRNMASLQECPIPPEHDARLREGYFIALMGGHAECPHEQEETWTWDRSLHESAKSFLSGKHLGEQDSASQQMLELVEHFQTTESLSEALENLPTTKGMEATFLASRIRLACHAAPEVADQILKRLRDDHWRSECQRELPLLAWEVLATGLLYLQARQGPAWHVEMPYIWLCGAEENSNDCKRAKLFVALMLMSSMSGWTVGAVKRLLRSAKLPELREVLVEIRSDLRGIRDAADQRVSSKFREICALLDILRFHQQAENGSHHLIFCAPTNSARQACKRQTPFVRQIVWKNPAREFLSLLQQPRQHLIFLLLFGTPIFPPPICLVGKLP